MQRPLCTLEIGCCPLMQRRQRRTLRMPALLVDCCPLVQRRMRRPQRLILVDNRMLALLVTTLVTFRSRKESPKHSIMIILSPLLSSLSLSLRG
jgi:hypothetical protein